MTVPTIAPFQAVMVKVNKDAAVHTMIKSLNYVRLVIHCLPMDQRIREPV